MSPFIILFAWGILSLAIENKTVLKLISVIVFAIAYNYVGLVVPLDGFAVSSATNLFERVIFIVIVAFILNEDKNINITQVIFLAVASIALLEAQTLISFIISFEALSIISLVIVSHITDKTTANGAVKMFIAGSIATVFIILGTSFYIFENHSLNATIQSTNLFGTVGLWIILLGIFYKLTIVPMHTWAADSYALIKPSHAAILSGVAKSVVAVATFHIFSPFLEQHISFSNPILIVFALLTMTLGNFLALFQKRVTKILVYSSIAHAGYMLLAFVALKSSYAYDGLIYVAIAYVFMQTALFMLVGNLTSKASILTLDNLKGLSSRDKISALFFSVQLFSLAGIPLLAGFISKAVLIYAVVDVDLPIVALVTLLNSALSVGYYAWIVKHIYFDDVDMEFNLKSLKFISLITQVILVCGTLYFGIFASLVFDAIP